MAIDPRSQKHLDTLLPEVRPLFVQLLDHLQTHFNEKGIIPKFICGTRTFEEQEALFAKGRTAPGPRVTNARGGFSNHNYGIAVDVGLFTPDGKYLEDTPFYREIGEVVALFPQLEWGGSWKTITDEPHVQYRTGRTIAQLRELVKSGKAIV
jgi:peptidoglycan L-alanyl-D-glutamate endopeptidase CwlK